MNARELGIMCALLAAMPNLAGCESARSQDYQFEGKRTTISRPIRARALWGFTRRTDHEA
jgi:hypothetical protein